MAGNPLVSMMGGNNPMAAMMQNNPIMQIINMAKSGKGNPMQMIQQMAGQNPQMKQAMDMMNGKDQNQVNEMIANMSKEKGINLSQLASQLGMPKSAAEHLGIKMD